MSNEELQYSIQELVKLIQSQNFEGTDEEIKIQQVLYFDKYVKEHVDYGFNALLYQEELSKKGITSIDSNPYKSAFLEEGFFEENELGQRFAVCGSISSIANKVLNQLGIKCDYVWGHFNIGSEQQPKYFGHRWNVLNIGGINYMVDFTAGLVIHNFEKNEEYASASQLFDALSSNDEYGYLFFDKLSEMESIGGFKISENGNHEDDINPDTKFLNNSSNNPYYVCSNLGTIPFENFMQYIPNEQRHVL